MIFFPRCPDCKVEMNGPHFEQRHAVHRDPDFFPKFVTGFARDLARIDCYYECPNCKSRTVFDPNWSENVR